MRPQNELLCIPLPGKTPRLKRKRSDFWKESLFCRTYEIATGSTAKSLCAWRGPNDHQLNEIEGEKKRKTDPKKRLELQDMPILPNPFLLEARRIWFLHFSEI